MEKTLPMFTWSVIKLGANHNPYYSLKNIKVMKSKFQLQNVNKIRFVL
jgi:hypothetical protein